MTVSGIQSLVAAFFYKRIICAKRHIHVFKEIYLFINKHFLEHHVNFEMILLTEPNTEAFGSSNSGYHQR